MSTKKRKVIGSEGRRIIASVYHFLKKEYEYTVDHAAPNTDFSHLRNITQRTADAAGVSCKTVQRILQEEKKLPNPSSDFPDPMAKRKKRESKIDKYSTDTVRQTIQKYYIDNDEPPTLAKLKLYLEEKVGFDGCIETIRKILLKLGYQWRKTENEHSKWLSTTFADVGVKVNDPKCQIVCEKHADPQFVQIIKHRLMLEESNCTEAKKKKSIATRTKDTSVVVKPGPSGIAQPKSAKKRKAAAGPCTCTTQSVDHLEVSDNDSQIAETALESSNIQETQGPEKRARLAVSSNPVLHDRVMFEVDIKEDPETFESYLSIFPDVVNSDDISLKEETLDLKDETEDAGNDSGDNRSKSPLYILPDAMNLDEIPMKQETVELNENTEGVNAEIFGYECPSLSPDKTDAQKLKETHSFNFEENKVNYLVTLKEDKSEILNDSVPVENKVDFESIDEMLNDLAAKNFITEAEKSILAVQKLPCHLLRPTHCKQIMQSPLKSFMITLYVFSHKGYEYVYSYYKTCLPPSSTIQDWLVQPRGHSGFTRETLEAINDKNQITEPGSGATYVCLDLRDIKLKPIARHRTKQIIKSLDWSKADAKAVLVMTAVAINAHWKLPIGYFWTNVVNCSERANLVKVAISSLERVGVKPLAISFDYNDDNWQMCTELNCSVDKLDLKTTFRSDSGKPIYLFPEPRGVLKRVYLDMNDNDLIDKSLQVVSLTHLPLLLKDIYDGQPATQEQLFWKAVASDNDFSNSMACAAGTVKFLKNIRVVTDVLDSRQNALNFKSAIVKSSNSFTNPSFVALQEAGKYFKDLRLKDSNQPTMETDKGRGILGLGALIDSALMIIYKHSNELGLGFGKFIGNAYFLANMSPQGQNKKIYTAVRFQTMYKEMLQNLVALRQPEGNNFPIENITILTCKSAIDRINLTTKLPSLSVTRNWLIENDSWKVFKSSTKEYENAIVEYIAGYVNDKLVRLLQCDKCIRALSRRNNTFVKDNNKNKNDIYATLNENKPSPTVTDICKTAEATFKRAVNCSEKLNPEFNVLFLLVKVMKKYVSRPLFESSLHHQFDTDPTSNHIVELTKAVAELYLVTRIQHHKPSAENKSKLKKRILAIFGNIGTVMKKKVLESCC